MSEKNIEQYDELMKYFFRSLLYMSEKNIEQHNELTDLLRRVESKDNSTLFIEQYKKFKKLEIDENNMGPMNHPVIYHLIYEGWSDTFIKLAKAGEIDVNHKSSLGSPLILAYSGHLFNGEIVNYLLAYPDIDINAQDHEGFNALFRAADLNRHSEFDVNDKYIKKLIDRDDLEVNTVPKKMNILHLLAKRKNENTSKISNGSTPRN